MMSVGDSCDVKVQLPIDDDGTDLQGAVSCHMKNVQSPPQLKDLESLNNALLSCRADEYECPFGRASVELVRILCELLKIGEAHSEQGESFEPLFFTHDHPFEECFCICIVLLNKTWKEMRATAEDFGKLTSVVQEQIVRALQSTPKLSNLDQLRAKLQQLTYSEITTLWQQERNSREEWESHATPTVELREQITADILALIKQQRLVFLVEGTRFTKYSQRGQRIKDKFWYMRLSPNHRVLYYGDCDEKSTPLAEELTFKLSVSDIRALLVGKDCPHMKGRKASHQLLAFSLALERVDLQSLDCVAPDELTLAYWTDGVNALLGQRMQSKEVYKDLDTLLSMEIKLRLLDAEEVTIPQDPPIIPPDPVHYRFCYDLNGSQSNLCNGSSNVPIISSGALRKVPNSSPNAQKKPIITLTHLPKRPAIDLQFNDLSYSVSEGRKRGYKTILKCVNGRFRSGDLTAIMGPSGAGKSTLMNILAGYKTANLTGSVLINGKERNLRRFRKMSCYIMQDDCLTPLLTVKEAMTVSAKLKLGKDVTQQERKVVINDVLESLNLQECRDTKTSSLSGGQRKRLSIALELVNNPPIMFFDEPTSGLDSSSCFQCICLLKSLARGGRTIICTIHQPSARLFEMFDYLYMMAEGQCIYRGQISALIPFLSSMNLHCPSYHNPADYVMEVACGEHGDYVQKLVIAVNAGRCNSGKKEEAVISNDIAKESTPMKITTSSPNETTSSNGVKNSSSGATCTTSLLDSSENIAVPSFSASGFQQFWILLKRTFLSTFRDQTLTRLRLISHVIIGILLGLIYYDVGNDAAKVQSNAGCIFFIGLFTMFSAMMPTILTFPLEMSVFLREHLNYWYSVKAYYFAKTLADIPFQIILTTSFIMGVYYLTSQPFEWARFGMLLTVNVLGALVSQSFGLLVGTVFDIEGGVFMGPVATIPLVLFCGFFANLDDIPSYMRWFSYLTYVKYMFEGSMVTIFGLNRGKLECTKDYCHFKYPEKFLDSVSIDGDYNTYVIDVLVLTGIFLFLRICVYFLLRLKILASR